MAKEYLDKAGLTYLWGKLKAILATKQSIRVGNATYNPNVGIYVGSSGNKKYARIALPNTATIWTMLFMEVSIRGDYTNGHGGKVLINTYHTATSPYTWTAFNATVVGHLPSTVCVYGSDGKYIYVMLNSSYQTVSVDKVLIGDSAQSYDQSSIAIDFVETLPTTYQTATMYFTENPSKVNGHTVNADVPTGAKFTDTNTTYSAGTGLSLSGTTFSNSGATGVKGNAETSYRTGNVNLTPANIGAAASSHTHDDRYYTESEVDTKLNGKANSSHTHTPNQITQGDSASVGSLDPLTQAMIGSAASNKTFGLPAAAIKVEYSRDGGSTWTDYGATDAEKKDLFAETRTTNFYIGKGTSKDLDSVNNRLRITIEPTDRYVYINGLYVWFSTQGNTCYVDLERSTIGAKDTFTTVFTGQQLTGWSGNNIRYFSGGTFGGGSTQTTNNYKYRLTFRQTAINANYPSAIIQDIRFLGLNVWSSPNNMVAKNHLYTWDRDLNATFPAQLTATQFNGKATQIRDSYNGNALTVTYGKAGQNSTSWIASWNNTELGAISPSKLDVGKVNGHTVNSDVPANAKFTDTTYSAVTTSANGLMTAADKTKLNGIATGAEVNQNAFSNVKVGSKTVSANGKTATFEIYEGDNVTLTVDSKNALQITAKDTTYSDATRTTHGLMTAALFAKLTDMESSADKTRLQLEGNTGGSLYVEKDDTIIVKGDGTYLKSALSQGTGDNDSDFTFNLSVDTSKFVLASAKGAANGVASLGSDGKVPSSQLPSTSSAVTGVKGNKETTYRTGNVNITAANIGAITGVDLDGSYTASTRKINIENSEGDGVTITLPEATTSAAGLMSSTDKTKVNNIGTVTTNTVKKAISTAGIDTYTNGASITLSAGTYIIVGRWAFNTGSSSAARNMGVAIGTSSTNWAVNRVYATNNSWASLECTHIATFTGSTTVYVRGACSMTYTSAVNTTITAVRIA